MLEELFERKWTGYGSFLRKVDSIIIVITLYYFAV
jgi:hypothetical protein